MTPFEFQAATGVSRETLARLDSLVHLLLKWQKAINLVSKNTLADVWRRHLLDSAQLMPLLPDGGTIVDLGSGAGFPGLVLAIMGAKDVHLVDSDQRKCAFLREAARTAGVAVTVHNRRIDQLPPLQATAVTSRACANLADLLGFAVPILAPNGQCLFLKGERWQGELTEAEKSWNMVVDRVPSITDPTGMILKLREIRRRHGHH